MASQAYAPLTSSHCCCFALLLLPLPPWQSSKQSNQTLADFVVDKLNERMPPQALLMELRKVMEDEADGFVTALWGLLAFHSAKLSAPK